MKLKLATTQILGQIAQNWLLAPQNPYFLRQKIKCSCLQDVPGDNIL